MEKIKIYTDSGIYRGIKSLNLHRFNDDEIEFLHIETNVGTIELCDLSDDVEYLKILRDECLYFIKEFCEGSLRSYRLDLRSSRIENKMAYSNSQSAEENQQKSNREEVEEICDQLDEETHPEIGIEYSISVKKGNINLYYSSNGEYPRISVKYNDTPLDELKLPGKCDREFIYARMLQYLRNWR